MSVFSGKKADVPHSSVGLSLSLLAVRTNLLTDKNKDPAAPRSGLAPRGTSAQRAGLEHVKLHGLRHFVATELLTAGIDLRTVSNRLGHARTPTTLDINWAWVPAQDEAAAEHLAAVLDPPAEIR